MKIWWLKLPDKLVGRSPCWDTEHTLTIPLWFFLCLCYIYQGNIQFISIIKNVYLVVVLPSRFWAEQRLNTFGIYFIIFTGIYRDFNCTNIFFFLIKCFLTLYCLCVTPSNHGNDLNNYEIFSEKILHSWGAIYSLYDYIFL